jgi:PAS domain S-box-containing protein
MGSDSRKTKAQLIIELDAARQRLRELEKYSIVENSNDGIVIIQNGVIKFSNARASELYGFSKEETVGKKFLDFVSPKERRKVAGIYQKRLLGKKAPSTYGSAIVNRDGLTIPVEISASIVDFEGAPATLAVVRDESEREKAETLLRESERKFKVLAEKSPNIVFINQAGRLVYANHKCEELMGYSRKELYSPKFNFMQLVAPESAAKVKNNFKKHTAGKEVPPIEYTIVTKDKRNIECILSTKLVDYNGSKAILGVITDISEQKRSERAQSLQAKMLDAVSDAIYVHDLDGYLIYTNDAASKISGYSRKELSGMHISTLHHPDSARLIEPRIRELLETGESTFEVTGLSKNGKLTPMEVHGALTTVGGSNVIISIARDVTERKRAQEALAFQANLLDTSKDTIVVHDTDGNFVYVNDSACAAFGYTRQEMLKMNLKMVSGDAETARLIRPRLEEIVKKGHASFEVTNRRKDGSEISREIHDSLLVVGGKKLIVGIGHDVTEKKRMQRQMIMQDRMASIGQFVSGIAHELNNPLTSVIGFSELLLQRELPGDVREDVKIVNYEAQRTSAIVKNLLTFTRQQPQEKQSILISDPIKAVVALRAHEQKVNNVKMKTDLPENLPLIRGNGSQLQQVFFNLISNAEFAVMEHRHKGTITIKAVRDGNVVRVSIHDDGTGISPENMKRLFSPFFTTKEPGQGTGLGLSICQGIVSEHGGRIWAESEKGKGSTFFIELPTDPG